MKPPVELRKPESINLFGKIVPEDEIVAIHKNLLISAFQVILSNIPHGAGSYIIHSGLPVFEEVLALYTYRTYVWVEEGDDAIIFYAHDSHALAVLYEQLEQGHYHFTFHLGSVNPNSITVFRNQGESLNALDREMELDTLVNDFSTPLEEIEGKE